LILDSFAGSGTTGHAVLQLNKEDGGNRRFILVEIEQTISREITAKRLTLVISGYADIPGSGGGFRYCTLADPLFDERGQINSSVKFADLAHHVFFTETGEPMPKRPDKRTPLLGVHNGRAIYLLFNGILGDKQPQGGNVLTNDVLKILPPHTGLRVIYGTACRLSANRLKREGVTFRQIPYEIKTD
jgi:adenine-specific DNA-methyltransferase